MELNPPLRRIRLTGTHRLVPSRYPTEGIFDLIASPADLDEIIDLESWTNDRIRAELGQLFMLPRREWVSGVPNATVIMAAFCHPRAGGGRFNGPELGAWYAARSLETAHRETVFHRTQELAEVGGFDTRMQMRLYLAAFSCLMHDIRRVGARAARLRDPNSYSESQEFAAALRRTGSNGIIYESVRHPGGACVAAFRPKLVRDVKAGAHFEYVWRGAREPEIRRLDRR